MGSDKNQLEYVLDQMSQAGTVTAKRMFGEYGIYFDGKIVALLCDNQVFVKPTVAGRAFIGDCKEAPPYPVAKLWFLIEDQIEDQEWLAQLIRITARELPLPKPKKRKPV